MTLNTNEPNDQRLVSEIPSYIRANRVALNAISGTGNVGVTDLEVAAGATSLSVGTEVGSYGFEILVVTGAGVADLETILGGTEGQVKVFIFQDTNVDIVDGNDKADGKFYLNHLPAASEFDPDVDDVLAVVNIGGDGASTYGYWKELFRTLSVK